MCTPTPTCGRYLPNVTPAQRRKRVLADHLPRRPGVYLFRGPGHEVLYVGTAVNLHRRVGQYFTGADPRGRMSEMVALAEPASTTSSARTPWRPGCANYGCWPRTRRPTTAAPGFRTAGGG